MRDGAADRRARWQLGVVVCAARAVLVWAVALGGGAAAQDQQATLRGLPGVAVAVTPIDADAERDGLRQAPLQALVERTLRSSAVPVLTLVEQQESPDAPRLRVTVLTYKGGNGVADPYFYTISVRLFQKARLVGTATALMPFVATWEGKTAIGVWPREDMGGLRGLVEDRVNEFALAWRAANPNR